MFKHHSKKTMALLLIFTLVLCSNSLNKAQITSHAINFYYGYDNGSYSIIDEKGKKVRYEGFSNKYFSSVSIPDIVEINGEEYKVTQIANNSLKNVTKVKNLVIGKNVTFIGKNAFYGCKNLKNVVIKTKGLTRTSVKANAFKNIHSSASITVPDTNINLYKTILKKAGINAKGQKITGKKMGNDTKPEVNSNSESEKEMTSLPKQSSGFSIGRNPYNEITETYTKDATETIAFSAVTKLHHDMYGTWKTKTVHKPDCFYEKCGTCGWTFESESLIDVHIPLADCPCVNDIFGTTSDAFEAHYFVPDDSPCRVTYRFEIPNGLSYKEGSIKAEAWSLMGNYDIDSSNYHVQVSGNIITVKVDDIKSTPYFHSFDADSYEKDPDGYELDDYEAVRCPIAVSFETEMNENASPENKVSVSITYEYKGMEETVNLGDATVYAASLKIGNTDESGNSLEGARFSVYHEEAVFSNGSKYGVLQWKKMPGSYKAGDIIKAGKGSYKIVQETAPAGHEKAYDLIVDVSISHGNSGTSITAKDGRGNNLPVHDGVIDAVIVNK